MLYRPLGKTGYSVSEIGFGGWGIGGDIWKGGSDQVSLGALHLAVDLGLNFIDTALSYGNGHSERLIGKLVSQRSERIYVATKIPPKNLEWPARKRVRLKEVFPKDHIVACTEKSLMNLGVERIDLQQFHVWAPNWIDEMEWYETLQQLKREGKVAHFGISINDHEPNSALDVVAADLIDTVQVIYNIFDPSAAFPLFLLCQEKTIGIIARSPFDEGALTGAITPETRFEPGDWREAYFTPKKKKEIAARVKHLKSLLDEAGASDLADLALRFCLSHPAVSTVIPGMRNTDHVYRNFLTSKKGPLSRQVLEKLAPHAWAKNFYSSGDRIYVTGMLKKCLSYFRRSTED